MFFFSKLIVILYSHIGKQCLLCKCCESFQKKNVLGPTWTFLPNVLHCGWNLKHGFQAFHPPIPFIFGIRYKILVLQRVFAINTYCRVSHAGPKLFLVEELVFNHSKCIRDFYNKRQNCWRVFGHNSFPSAVQLL